MARPGILGFEGRGIIGKTRTISETNWQEAIRCLRRIWNTAYERGSYVAIAQEATKAAGLLGAFEEKEIDDEDKLQ